VDTTKTPAETTYSYQAVAVFSAKDKIPSHFGQDTSSFASLQLEHPLTVKKQDLFFLVNYYADFKFLDRRSKALYGDPWDYIPLECKALDQADSLTDSVREDLEAKREAGYIQYTAVMLKDLYLKALNITLKKRADIVVDSILLREAGDTLQEILTQRLTNQQLNENSDLGQLWASDFSASYELLRNKLKLPDDSTLVSEIQSAGNLLTKEYLITEDLNDESFVVDISVPGIIRSSNSDTLEGEFQRWQFNGADLADSTITISLVATIYHPLRLYIAGGILVIGIGIFLWALLKPKKTNA
jgi:hypothetical protein